MPRRRRDGRSRQPAVSGAGPGAGGAAPRERCTGVRDGTYDFAGLQIARQAEGALKVVMVNTQVSPDNLARLDHGGCDAAIVP